MSTNSNGRAGPSYSLRRINALIYGLPIRPPLKKVLLAYAHHCDYFTGTNARPKLATVAQMACLSVDSQGKCRRLKYLLAQLRADPKCRKCKGVGIAKGSTGPCPCQRDGKGYLVAENSGTGGAGVATQYRLNLAAMEKFLPREKGAISSRKGAVFNTNGAVQKPKGGCFEQRNKEDRIDRIDREDRGAPPRKGVSSATSQSSKLEQALQRIRSHRG